MIGEHWLGAVQWNGNGPFSGRVPLSLIAECHMVDPFDQLALLAMWSFPVSGFNLRLLSVDVSVYVAVDTTAAAHPFSRVGRRAVTNSYSLNSINQKKKKKNKPQLFQSVANDLITLVIIHHCR